MEPLEESDVQGLQRDATNRLVPTKTTAALNHYQYEIKKGSIHDKLFSLQKLDPAPRAQPLLAPPALAPPALAQIGDPGVFEVEAIRQKRATPKRVKYLIKWLGYPEAHNTWESPTNINKQLVAAFEGRLLVAAAPAAAAAPARPPSLPNRGQGCARANLSGAGQRRGVVPSSLSMVCGNMDVKFRESRTKKNMPSLTLTFKVLTMDSAGHITWPTMFAAATQAALRLQARSLLRKMIDDPLNPCNNQMAPALVGTGMSSVWQGPPRRTLVVVQPAAQ